MDQYIQQIGIGGIFAILVIREVLNFLEKRRASEVKAHEPPCQKAQADLSAVRTEVGDLHAWHDRRDAEGVPIWYFRKSYEQKLERIETELKALRETIQRDSVEARRVFDMIQRDLL